MGFTKTMKKKLLLICILWSSTLFFSACNESGKTEYESFWKEGVNVEIIKTLVKNKIRGCGQFKYKANLKLKGNYIVYCTRDDINWTAYIVYTNNQKVLGPYSPSPEYD